MNKYQEALDVINTSDDEKFIKDSSSYFEKYKLNPVAVIQKLVDKETPMKPLKLSEGDFCRNCKCEIPENVEKYCPHCGQKLDWR